MFTYYWYYIPQRWSVMKRQLYSSFYPIHSRKYESESMRISRFLRIFGGHFGFSGIFKIAQRCNSGMLANINLSISSINNPKNSLHFPIWTIPPSATWLYYMTQIIHCANRIFSQKIWTLVRHCSFQKYWLANLLPPKKCRFPDDPLLNPTVLLFLLRSYFINDGNRGTFDSWLMMRRAVSAGLPCSNHVEVRFGQDSMHRRLWDEQIGKIYICKLQHYFHSWYQITGIHDLKQSYLIFAGIKMELPICLKWSYRIHDSWIYNWCLRNTVLQF